MVQYINYTITQGDTLQLIAQKILGDSSQWADIARFNNLKHPYITNNPSDKVTNPRIACVGDTIIVENVNPDSQNLLSTAAVNRVTSNYVDELLLGRDLKLVPTTGKKDETRVTDLPLYDDFLELSADKTGGVAMTVGVRNVVQAVTRRIMTERGSLYLHPEYGSELHLFRGEGASYETLKLIELDCKTTALQDGRVSKADAKAQLNGGNGVTIDMQVHIRNNTDATSFSIGYDRFGTITYQGNMDPQGGSEDDI